MAEALSIVQNVKTEENVNVLDKVSLGELVNTLKESYRIVHVLENVRNKRILEIDYTFQINELVETFKLTHELSEQNTSVKVRTSKYRKGGTRWYFQFSYLTQASFDYRLINSYNIDISHIPHSLNVGNRIEIVFKDTYADIDPFFKQFTVTKNQHNNSIVSIQFEDPNKVLEILSHLSNKLNL